MMFLPNDQNNPGEKERKEIEGPLSLLHRSMVKIAPIVVSLRNNRKVIGNVVAYDRHYNLLMSNAKEVGVVGNKNRGKKKREGREFSRELGNMFIRGDGVILVANASTNKE